MAADADMEPRACLSLDALKHAPLALRDREEPALPVMSRGLARAVPLAEAGAAAAYFQLRPGVDLNVPPPNWLQSRLPDGTAVVQPGRAASLDAIAGGASLAGALAHVDFVAPAVEMKQILTMPFSGAQVSLAVFRVGETLLVAPDGAGIVGAPQHWGGLPRPALLAAPALAPPRRVAASVVRKNPRNSERRELFSKFMYRSTLVPGAGAAAAGASDVGAAPAPPPGPPAAVLVAKPSRSPVLAAAAVALGMPAPMSLGGGAAPAGAAGGPGEGVSTAPFRRVSQWQLDGLSLVLGSDLMTFRNDAHACVSLRLHDISEPMPLAETLDMYLDNVMADVPAAAICYHSHGVVEAYQVVPTSEIPNIGAEPFSPYVLEQNAATLLRFLQANCARDCGSYWLFRPAGGNVAQLYDLSLLASQSTRSRYLIAMLCLRVASQLRRVAEAAPGGAAAAAPGAGPPPAGSAVGGGIAALIRQRELLLKSVGLLEGLLGESVEESRAFYSALISSVRIELAGACEQLALREHAHLDANSFAAAAPAPGPPSVPAPAPAPRAASPPPSPQIVARSAPVPVPGDAALARYCTHMNDAAHHVIAAMAELRARVARNAAAAGGSGDVRASPPNSPPRASPSPAGGDGGSPRGGGGAVTVAVTGGEDPVVADALEALAGLRARLVTAVARIGRALVREGRGGEFALRVLEDAVCVCTQAVPGARGGGGGDGPALSQRSLMEVCGAAGDLAHACAPPTAGVDPSRYGSLLRVVLGGVGGGAAELPWSLTRPEAMTGASPRSLLAFEVACYAAACVAATRAGASGAAAVPGGGAGGGGGGDVVPGGGVGADGAVYNRRLGDALAAWGALCEREGDGAAAAAAYVRGGVALREAGDAANAAGLFCNASRAWLGVSQAAHAGGAARAPALGERNAALAFAGKTAALAGEALDGRAAPLGAGRRVLEATARVAHVSGVYCGQDAEREGLAPEDRDESVRRACALLERAGALYTRAGNGGAAASCELHVGLAIAGALRTPDPPGGDGARRRRYTTLAERHLGAAEVGGWAARDPRTALSAALALARAREAGSDGGSDPGAGVESALDACLGTGARLATYRAGGGAVVGGWDGHAGGGGGGGGCGAGDAAGPAPSPPPAPLPPEAPLVRELAGEVARLAQRLAAAASHAAGGGGGGGGGSGGPAPGAKRAAQRTARARAVLKAVLPALRRGTEERDVEAALCDAAAAAAPRT